MSVKIDFGILYVNGWDKNDETIRLNISNFDDDIHSHIHGELIIEFNGKRIETIGFFGLDDCCFNEWYSELKKMIGELENTQDYYLYKDLDQGQPNYLFELIKNELCLTIYRRKKTEFKEEDIIDKWDKVSVDFKEFKVAFEEFERKFKSKLYEEINPEKHYLLIFFFGIEQ